MLGMGPLLRGGRPAERVAGSESVASILIIVVSAALMFYWFRYMCLLMLRTRTGNDYASDLAAGNDLSFNGIREQTVGVASAQQLGELERSLDRDYHILTYLLSHTASLRAGGLTMEQRMLMLDFRLMQGLCWLTRRLATRQARAAVVEMAEVLTRLANDMGERVHASSRA